MIRYLCPAKSFFIINHHHYQSFFNTSCKMWADDLLKTTKFVILDAKQQTNFFCLVFVLLCLVNLYAETSGTAQYKLQHHVASL